MRGRILMTAVLAGLATELGGCGFHPLYAPMANGKPGPAQAEMAAVQVAIIPDRAGQLLRQALQARLGGDGTAKRYELSVAYGLGNEALGIQSDNSATRLRVTGIGTWTLRALTPERPVVASGSVRDLDGLNVFNNQYFGMDLELETVQRRVTENLADQIALQLGSYFLRQARATAKS